MQGAGPTPPDELLQRESQANSFVTNMATSRVRVQLVREWQSDLVCWGRAPTGSSIRARMSYFGILEDTLLGRWLPAYTKRPKGHLIGAPKFYFADVGVVNQLARRGTAPLCVARNFTAKRSKTGSLMSSPPTMLPRSVRASELLAPGQRHRSRLRAK